MCIIASVNCTILHLNLCFACNESCLLKKFCTCGFEFNCWLTLYLKYPLFIHVCLIVCMRMMPDIGSYASIYCCLSLVCLPVVLIIVLMSLPLCRLRNNHHRRPHYVICGFFMMFFR